MRASLAAAFCAGLAGCMSLSGNPDAPDPASALQPAGPSLQVAAAAIVPGQSKDDVRARLGNAIEIQFDSGYEVWLYRDGDAARGSGARTELVILFTPTGVVKKTRVRPPDVVPVR